MHDEGAGAGDEGLLADAVGDRQRLARFKRWFDQSARANDAWRADAIESRKFVNNDQWPSDDTARLAKAKRPRITVNKILPRVQFLKGVQRSQREEPKLLPFEGGDARHAELMGALYKWYGTRSREPVVDSAVFDNKIVDGLGFWKVSWNFDEDPEGNLLWERVDGLAVFPDPNWLDAGWQHCEYVIQAMHMTLDEAMDYWPDRRQEIKNHYGEWLSEASSSGAAQSGGGEFAGDTFSSDRSYWDPQTQRLRVLEIWYKKRTQVRAIQRVDSGEITSDPERVDTITQALQMQPELAAGFRPLKIAVTKVCVAHVTGDILFDDEPTPYRVDTLPLFPTVGFYWWKHPFGIVTPLKDLQREKNRRRSTLMEMVQRAALSGFFNQESQGAKREDLENYASGTGKVISFKTVRPELIQPPEIPQSVVFLERGADADMDSVSNIHAELLGTTTQRTTSGRAIKARQQSGLLVQEPLLESFNQDKEPAVRFALELIQQFTTPSKAARILGTMAVRQPQGQVGQMMQDSGFMDVQSLLSDALSQQFDVVVGSKPWEPSLQVQKWSQLAELLQQFGEYIPPDVIVDALKNAGLFTEDEAMKTLAYAQQKMAMDQQQQAAATAGRAPAPPNRAA